MSDDEKIIAGGLRFVVVVALLFLGVSALQEHSLARHEEKMERIHTEYVAALTNAGIRALGIRRGCLLRAQQATIDSLRKELGK